VVFLEKEKNTKTESDVQLCNKPLFIIVETVSVAISAVFIYICTILSRNVKIKMTELI